MRYRAPLFASSALVLSAAAALVLSGGTPSQAARLELTILPDAGLKKTGPTTVQHSFGEVAAYDAGVVKRNLVLRNDNRAPLEIAFVQVTCGCSSAVLQSNGASASGSGTPKILAPGEKVTVQVMVDLTKLSPGGVSKYAYVYLQGRQDPAVTLQIQGAVLPSLVYKPSVADFGSAPFGKGETRRLIAVMDARLASAADRLTPVSTNPLVSARLVEPTAAEQEFAVHRKGISSSFRPAKAAVRAIQVTLSREAPIGLVEGAVLLTLPGVSYGDGDSAADVQKRRVVSALSRVPLPIGGEVTGDVSASPPSLLFGTVTQGKETSRQVTLRGVNPEVLDGLRVSGGGPWIAAGVNPAPGGDRKKAVLSIAIRGNAPSSYVNEKVSVTLKNGQRLVVPIIATIVPGR